MNNFFICFVICPAILFGQGQLKKYDFHKDHDDKLVALTWIVEDSISGSATGLVFPISATNQEKRGCLCAIQTDARGKTALVLCKLTSAYKYRETSIDETLAILKDFGSGYMMSNEPKTVDGFTVFRWSAY